RGRRRGAQRAPDVLELVGPGERAQRLPRPGHGQRDPQAGLEGQDDRLWHAGFGGASRLDTADAVRAVDDAVADREAAEPAHPVVSDSSSGSAGETESVPSRASSSGGASLAAARAAAASAFFACFRSRRSLTACSRARFAIVCGFLGAIRLLSWRDGSGPPVEPAVRVHTSRPT